MFLIEAEGKQILAQYGLPVPRGRLVSDPSEIGDEEVALAIKAQVLSGKRGKSGLVRLAEQGHARRIAEEVIAAASSGRPPLLVEQRIEAITSEYYISWAIDDVTQKLALSFSVKGGVDVEDNPEAVGSLQVEPTKVLRPHHLLEFLSERGVTGRQLGPVARFAVRLLAIFRQEDALLVEINPLAVTAEGALIALDAKVSLDDNAAPRHPGWRNLRSRTIQSEGMSPLERRAAEAGTTFVHLDGSVALLTGGAGLGMAIVDMLSDEGLHPANFVDAPGGTSAGTFAKQATLVFERAAATEVNAILLYLSLSATSLKQSVDGLTAFLERNPPPKPLVVGLVATGSATHEMSLEEAQVRFRSLGYQCSTELTEVVDQLKRIARNTAPRAPTPL